MERCSTSLVIRDMQIKTIMRYDYTSIRIGNVKKRDHSYADENVEELQLSYTAGGKHKMVPLLWKT